MAGIGAGSRERGGDDLWEITCWLYCADGAWHAKIKRNYIRKKKRKKEKEDEWYFLSSMRQNKHICLDHAWIWVISIWIELPALNGVKEQKEKPRQAAAGPGQVMHLASSWDSLKVSDGFA